MYSKSLRKVALMKMAGAKWGANINILTKLYTAISVVRPHMEYAFNAWSIAARTGLDQLTTAHNVGLSIFTVGMKTSPISDAGKKTGPLSLEERREEKLLTEDEEPSFTPSIFQMRSSH